MKIEIEVAKTNGSLRAVTYARVSKDDTRREGRNLQGQLDMCRDYAAQHGYRLITELAEDERGASGAAWDLPKLNQALDLARNRQFDVLVVRELDRFARDLAKQLVIEAEFKRAGVEVEYVLGDYPDTPEGQLNKHLRAVIAEYERVKIQERMVRGRRLKVKNGDILLHGKPPSYGYRLSEDGKSLVIYEPEARIVRMIFTWYVEGDETGRRLSANAIAEKLTELGVPTWHDIHGHGKKRRGYGQWAYGTVTKMLSNETYIGRWHYGQRKSKTEFNPPSHWLTIEVPPIISQEVWDKVQAQKARNKQMARRNKKRNYLVAQRVTCGQCGQKMFGLSVPRKTKQGEQIYSYYKCNARAGKIAGVACDLPSFKVREVDTLIWNHLVAVLTSPETLSQGLEDYLAQRERTDGPLRERLEVVQGLIADNKGQLDRLLNLYLSGDFPKDLLIERKKRLEDTITALEKEQDNLASHLDSALITVEKIEDIQQAFSELVMQGVDLANADFETKREIVHLLNVTVTLAIEEDQEVVYVHHTLDTDAKRLSIADCNTGFTYGIID